MRKPETVLRCIWCPNYTQSCVLFSRNFF